ncbi:RDD family protein [Algicella marina]|uniref:RDD family protein n=1 Tax=Algicella marina TaxID=2683284 RepID=A0A6P1SZJ7_9RHOB|nr:RDD family protein [Algicella marina]QHQ34955.1 RDD family protein [Algicella marina]
MTMTLPHPEYDAQFYESVPLKRLIAFFVDIVLIGLISAVAVLALTLFTLGLGIFLTPMLVLLISFLYRWRTIAVNSATPGMAFMGIELRNRAGHRLSSQDAFIHTGIFVALTLTLIGWIATVISIMATDRHQGLPDLLLGSVALNRPAD